MAEQHERATRAMSRTSRIVGTVLVIIVAAVCIRLGFWQIQRLQEKRTINAALEERGALPPIQLTGAIRDSAGIVFRHATASGEYDNDRTVILPGRGHRGAPGVLAVTPLIMRDGSAVLVQRGWVPAPDGASVDIAPLHVDSLRTVTGLLLPFLARENTLAVRADMAPSDTFQRVLYRIEPERLRAAFPYPLLPVTLQRLPTAARGDTTGAQYPLAQAAPVLDDGPHLGYAIQWFSFALIFLIGWVALLWSRRGSGGGRNSGNRSLASKPA